MVGANAGGACCRAGARACMAGCVCVCGKLCNLGSRARLFSGWGEPAPSTCGGSEGRGGSGDGAARGGGRGGCTGGMTCDGCCMYGGGCSSSWLCPCPHTFACCSMPWYAPGSGRGCCGHAGNPFCLGALLAAGGCGARSYVAGHAGAGAGAGMLCAAGVFSACGRHRIIGS